MRKHTLAALLMGCILLLLPAAAQAELPDENGEGFLGTTFETMRREIQEGERDVGILLYVQLSSIEEYRGGWRRARSSRGIPLDTVSTPSPSRCTPRFTGSGRGILSP